MTYSFAALDPDGSGLWLATEYIPSKADQDPLDDWGTYVFEVSGRWPSSEVRKHPVRAGGRP